ncbi:MAG: glutathione S-transferase family protein [Chromatiales bacterium]|jgi:glutathione S-transferase|nr:glutathione S-transferase family protein [Chromatiales bacterium]
MIKFFFSPSTSSLATHIALIECGADYELNPTLLSKQETRTPAYLAVNPAGTVPALATANGTVITEVAGTLHYLARLNPDAGLWPLGNIEAESQVISWMSFAASTMHGARKEGPTAIAEAFELANKKLGDREWCVGTYSIADIHVFRIFWRFRREIDASAGTYPALESHHDRMLARPAVQRAMEIEKAYA